MASGSALATLLITAVLTGVIHTIAGPDHYLPFIAIARSRHYSLGRTLLWTLICGIGHVGSALLLAVLFLLFAELLSAARLEWLEEWRGNIAAYAMIGMGGAMLLHSLHRRWRNRPRKHVHLGADGVLHVHSHAPEGHDAPASGESLSYWVVFIIFVLGPCEALLPLLTASAVLGTASVILTASVFSIATIATMLGTVALGVAGLNILRFAWLERHTAEIAGVTVMLCGLAIAVLGL